MVLSVPGPGFPSRFWASFGCKASADGPDSGPGLPGPKAPGILGPDFAPFEFAFRPKPA
jgi:hypothetical protein